MNGTRGMVGVGDVDYSSVEFCCKGSGDRGWELEGKELR